MVHLQFFRYEKSGHLIGNEYFLHAYGPIYVLSKEVVASLAAARNDRFVSLETRLSNVVFSPLCKEGSI